MENQIMSKYVKRMLAIVVLSVAAALVVKLYFNHSAEHEARQQVIAAEEMEYNKQLAEMLKRTNSIADWEKALCKDDRMRIGPVFTNELQDLWLTGRPIYFIGFIDDIENNDENSYIVEIKRSLISDGCFILDGIILRLVADRNVIDTFLKTNGELYTLPTLFNNVNIVAKIENIQSEIHGSGDEKEKVKVGVGSMLEIMAVRNANTEN